MERKLVFLNILDKMDCCLSYAHHSFLAQGQIKEFGELLSSSIWQDEDLLIIEERIDEMISIIIRGYNDYGSLLDYFVLLKAQIHK